MRRIWMILLLVCGFATAHFLAYALQGDEPDICLVLDPATVEKHNGRYVFDVMLHDEKIGEAYVRYGSLIKRELKRRNELSLHNLDGLEIKWESNL